MDGADEEQMPSSDTPVEHHPARPESGSSVNSGEMVQSSLGRRRGSTEIHDEEVQYQRELKDRIKRSYVDLGMKPEGILLRGDDDNGGGMMRDSLEIDDNLDYGVIKFSDSGSQGMPLQGDREENGEGDESRQTGDNQDTSSNHSERVMAGNNGENSEQLEGEFEDQSDIPGGRSSRQGEANGEGETDSLKDPKNVSTLDVTHGSKQQTWEDHLRDSPEEDPSGQGEEYLRDSLEGDDALKEKGEGHPNDGPLQPGEVDVNAYNEEEINPNRTKSGQSEHQANSRNSGDNVNNNAQSVESPPPGQRFSRTVSSDENRDKDVVEDTGQQGQFDMFDDYGGHDGPEKYDENMGYASNYAENEEYDLRQDGDEESGVSLRVTNQDEFQNSQSEEDLESGGHQHQTYSEAYAERRQPPPPPTMPPEPPPPMLPGKPPSAGRISRPTTNPFNVDGDQDDFTLYQHPDAAMTRLTRTITPPPPPNKTRTHSPLPRNMPRTHPSPPPPLTTQQNSSSYSGSVQQPPADEDQSERFLETKSPEESYLDQFRDKQGFSEGNDTDTRKMTPSRTSNKSRPQAKAPSGSAGSRASLDGLRFQNRSRKEDGAGAHHRQKEQGGRESSSVKKKPQVEYISEDSDDEDLHFVDEFGNPVDAPGNQSEESPSPVEEEESPKLEYRMKRVPSKKKQESSSGQRGSVASETRESVSPENKKVSRTSQIPSASNRAVRKTPTSRAGSKVSRTSQIPIAAPTGRPKNRDEVGRSNTPESQSISEITQTDLPITEEIASSVSQREGERENTVPSHKSPSSSVRGISTGGHTPLQSQVPQYMGHVGQQPQYMNPQMLLGYQGYQQMPSQFVTGPPVPGQMLLTNQAAFISPNASYAFAPQVYAQLQPVLPLGMSPLQTVLQPVVQQPQMFVGGAQQVQPPRVIQLPVQQQYQPVGSSGLADPQHVQVGSRGPGSGGGGYVDVDGRRTGGTEHSPPPEEEIPTPGQSGKQRKHPNGVRGLLAERREAGRNGQARAEKKTPDSPKTRKNFIDANRNNVKNSPSGRKYREMHANKVKSGKSPMDNRQPLPNISQETGGDAGERWAYREDAAGTGEEEWTKRLIEDQRMMVLSKRSQSESNVLNLQGNLQGQATLSPGQDGGVRGDARHSPRVVPGQMYSYSADRAVLQARMQDGGYGSRRPAGDDTAVPRVGGRASERERLAYTHPMPARCSPFEVLPDIERTDNETRTSDPDGYLVKLQKQRHQQPGYKEYTLKDYRAMKRDIKLGGLGPDPNLVQERQEKAQRQKEYARAIMEQNKRALKKASKPWTPPREQPPSLGSTKRGLALTYAKSISRPPVRTNQEELHAQLYGRGSQQSNASGREGAKTYMLEEMDKLEELAERHRQEKEEIEKLRNGHAP